jgi:transposase
VISIRRALPDELKALLRSLAVHWAQVRAIIGVGPLAADAMAASLGSAKDFSNGRQLAAWLGLVPTQHSSGGHARLGTISCRGDAYLRTLLIQGARSSLQRAKAVSVEKSTPEQIWIRQLACRMPFGKLLVAIANKHARQLWAMLAHNENYDADAWLKHPMVQRPAGKHAITSNAMA